MRKSDYFCCLKISYSIHALKFINLGHSADDTIYLYVLQSACDLQHNSFIFDCNFAVDVRELRELQEL